MQNGKGSLLKQRKTMNDQEYTNPFFNRLSKALPPVQPTLPEGGYESPSQQDTFYMSLAIEQAKLAAMEGEVPVGALALWEDGRVVGLGRNRREGDKCALCHGEIEAIAHACGTLHGWRLHKCTLYVTLEPCPMCAGAIMNARIKRVVYGAKDPKAGAYGSLFHLNDLAVNHKPEIVGGVMEQECAALLKDFFASLREKRTGG